MHGGQVRTSDETSCCIRASRRALSALLVTLLLCGCAHGASGPAFATGTGADSARLTANDPVLARYCDSVLRFPDLASAALRGDDQFLRSWLESGGNPDIADPDGHTLLLVAAAAGQVEAATLLLSAGADASTVDSSGAGLLHHAALAPDATLLEHLLARAIPGGPSDARDSFDHTPLMDAVAAGRLAAARVLLAHGASPFAADHRGETPLLLLCREGPPVATDILRLLVEAGADPALPGPDGNPPLAVALKSGNGDLARALLALDVPVTPQKCGFSPLLAAAAGALPDMLALLAAEAPGGLSQSGSDGTTVLVAAACERRRSESRDGLVLTLLRTSPPDPKTCPQLVECAVENDLSRSLAVLRTRCPDVPPADELLVQAARACSPGLVSDLLGAIQTTGKPAGMSVEAPGPLSRAPAPPGSPLPDVAGTASLAVPDSIQSSGVPCSSPQTTLSCLDRALLEASRQGCAPAVKLLLAHGASPTSLDSGGSTPLDLALAGAEFLAPEFGAGGAPAVETLGERLPGPAGASGRPLDFPGTVSLLLRAGAADGHADGENLLSLAVRTGSADVVKAVLQHRPADLEAAAAGLSPLAAAALSGGPAVLAVLLDSGADPLLPDPSGESVMAFAAQAGSIESTCLLVAAGAPIDQAGPGGESPLHHAARFGSPDLTALLLAAGAHPYRVRRDGRIPLHLAAASGNEQTVMLLLRAFDKADPVDAAGVTPLHLAAGAGHLTVVRRLIEAGANPLSVDRRGLDAICFAAAGGADQVIVELLERQVSVEGPRSGDFAQARFPPLLLATQGNHLAAAKKLLAAGADIEVRNAAGWTPLMMAAYNGNLRMVKLFLKKGANLSASDPAGWTALTAAIRSGAAKTACTLVVAGAETNPSRGPNLLRIATRAGYAEIADCLRAHGAEDSIDSQDP